MRWKVHGERTLYESHWLSFGLADVELPTGRRFEHEVIRTPTASAGTIVYVTGRGLLLLHRHRFIPDESGWEIPAGRVEPKEEPAAAAAREVVEETGWQPAQVRPLFHYTPSSGMCDQTFYVFFAAGASRVGDATDWYESDSVRWLPLGQVRDAVANGDVRDGMTLTALCWAWSFGPLAGLA